MCKFKEEEDYAFFTASETDCEAHGKEIYQRALNGEFGDIEPSREECISPEELSEEYKKQAEADIRKKRNSKLVHTDWTQLHDIDEEKKNMYKPYRQELRDISKQKDFPFQVTWPVLCQQNSK